MKIIADKKYAYWLAEQTFQKEFYKFPQHDITYDGMKELLNTNYIQDVSEYKNKKCIVLGNGGSVLDNERGIDIDKFDLIVRSNLARFEGFEKHVGSRTDIRFLSHKTFGNTLDKNYSSYEEDYVPNSKQHHLIIRSAGNVGSMIPGFAKNRNNMFSVLDIEYNKHLDKLVSNNHYCSVGFSAIHTMIDLGCDVYIYGFDFYNPKKKYHYFEECSPMVQTGRSNHEGDREKEYIMQLIEEGKLKKF